MSKHIINEGIGEDSQEWNTPQYIADKINKVFDYQIDLDVASNPEANNIIKALHYFARSDNALAQSWIGENLYCNCPGGRNPAYGNQSNATLFWNYALNQYKIGNFSNLIWMCFSIEQLAINPTMWDHLICILRHRIPFIQGNKSSPRHANAIILVSDNDLIKQKFNSEFEELGRVGYFSDYYG